MRKICGKCKSKISSHLLAEMCINGKYTSPICPRCALEIRNEIHGLPADMIFCGEVAQDMYEQQIEEKE